MLFTKGDTQQMQSQEEYEMEHLQPNDEMRENLDLMLEELYTEKLDDAHKPEADYPGDGDISVKDYGELDELEKASIVAEIVNGETNIETYVEEQLENEVDRSDVMGWADENYFPGGTRISEDHHELRTEDMEEREIRNW